MSEGMSKDERGHGHLYKSGQEGPFRGAGSVPYLALSGDDMGVYLDKNLRWMQKIPALYLCKSYLNKKGGFYV